MPFRCLGDPAGLLHQLCERAFLDSESVASSVKLLADDAEFSQVLQMFFRIAVGASRLPGYS